MKKLFILGLVFSMVGIFGAKNASVAYEETNVEIPSTINNKPVSSIYQYAFYNCTSIASVITTSIYYTKMASRIK